MRIKSFGDLIFRLIARIVVILFVTIVAGMLLGYIFDMEAFPIVTIIVVGLFIFTDLMRIENRLIYLEDKFNEDEN